MFSKLAKLIIPAFLFFFFLTTTLPLLASDKFTLYFFYGKYCPHCAKEEKFLDQLEEKYSFLEVKRYEVTEDYENSQLLKKVAQRLNVDVRGVPFTVVHEKTFIGYLNDETTGREIEAAINQFHQIGCLDPVADLFPQAVEKEEAPEEVCEEEASPQGQIIKLPFFGEIHTASFSLPVLTILIAGADGFNPCAMWVLFFLISLLLGMKDKKKMWLLGGTFIAASALVYFLFLSAWLSLFLFIGFIFWVRLLIGAVAIGSGAYYLKEFWTNPAGACQAVGQKNKKKIINRMKEVLGRKQLFTALVGIVLLAFAVNLVELVCSAGLPAVYTQILSLAKISPFQRSLYLLLYILIFMLDDMFVFWLAMRTLSVVGLSGKYSRYSNLIGGGLIFILGILLIFKPEWIMFG